MVLRRFASSALLASLVALAAVPGIASAAGANANGMTSAAPAWLGVSMANASDGGAGVKHVVRGSPAEKGGVRAGDRLVSIDGASVGGPGDVSRKVALHAPGDVLTVLVKRGDADVTLHVELAARPTSDEQLRMDFIGAFAPAWSGALPLSGAPASIGDLRGHVVVLDFWASWCGRVAISRRDFPSFKRGIVRKGSA